MTTSARDQLERYLRDPVAFCREVLGFEPWSKQREILESVRDHTRTAVRSCHGPGKTAVAARCALWFLSVFEHSKVITTAPTFHQVRELLWAEIHVAYRDAGGFIAGQLSDTRLELAPDWVALGLSTDQPEPLPGPPRRAPATRRRRGLRRRRGDLRGSRRLPHEPRRPLPADRQPDPHLRRVLQRLPLSARLLQHDRDPGQLDAGVHRRARPRARRAPARLHPMGRGAQAQVGRGLAPLPGADRGRVSRAAKTTPSSPSATSKTHKRARSSRTDHSSSAATSPATAPTSPSSPSAAAASCGSRAATAAAT